jgi:hypothetical protein
MEVMTERLGMMTLVVSYLPPRPTSMEAKSHLSLLKYSKPVAVRYSKKVSSSEFFFAISCILRMDSVKYFSSMFFLLILIRSKKENICGDV